MVIPVEVVAIGVRARHHVTIPIQLTTLTRSLRFAFVRNQSKAINLLCRSSSLITRVRVSVSAPVVDISSDDGLPPTISGIQKIKVV